MILLFFAALVGVGAYGFSEIQVAGDVNNYIPPGTSLERFVKTSEAYMNTVRLVTRHIVTS